MIDLHLHTTASDGRLAPEALVARAAGLGLTIISLTDHDTTAGLAEATAAATQHGVRLVPGIEITAVERGRDVHVLGYFIDPDHAPFVVFLDAQREDRRRRVETMIARLAELGMPLDGERLLGPGFQILQDRGEEVILEPLLVIAVRRSQADPPVVDAHAFDGP